ncbi:hypothetical protein ACLOJK_024268 [Asimina triloba]
MGGSGPSIAISATIDRGDGSLVVEEMGSVTLRLLLLAMSSGASSPVEIGRRKVCHEFGDDAANGHRTSNLDRDLPVLGLTSMMHRLLSLPMPTAGDEEDVAHYASTTWIVWKRLATNDDDVYAFRLTTPCL